MTAHVAEHFAVAAAEPVRLLHRGQIERRMHVDVDDPAASASGIAAATRGAFASSSAHAPSVGVRVSASNVSA